MARSLTMRLKSRNNLQINLGTGDDSHGEEESGRVHAQFQTGKTIEKDFQACEELLRSGAGRNEWVEENCKRMKSWQEAAEAGDARGQMLYGL